MIEENNTPAVQLTTVQKRILADQCAQKLEDGEPFFMLLGRDRDAAVALHAWIEARRIREGDSKKVNAAEETYWKFGDWQREVECRLAGADE